MPCSPFDLIHPGDDFVCKWEIIQLKLSIILSKKFHSYHTTTHTLILLLPNQFGSIRRCFPYLPNLRSDWFLLLLRYSLTCSCDSKWIDYDLMWETDKERKFPEGRFKAILADTSAADYEQEEEKRGRDAKQQEGHDWGEEIQGHIISSKKAAAGSPRYSAGAPCPSSHLIPWLCFLVWGSRSFKPFATAVDDNWQWGDTVVFLSLYYT